MSEVTSQIIPLDAIVPGCRNGKFARLAHIALGLLGHATQEVKRYGLPEKVEIPLRMYNASCDFREARYRLCVNQRLGAHAVEEVYVMGSSQRLSIRMNLLEPEPKPWLGEFYPQQLTVYDNTLQIGSSRGSEYRLPGMPILSNASSEPTLRQYNQHVAALEDFARRGEFTFID